MKRERLIEILANTIGCSVIYIKENQLSKPFSTHLAAMQRAVEEETTRLRQCEAIVRELAKDDTDKYQMSLDELIHKARQWVKDNNRHTPGDDGGRNTNKL